MKIQEVKIPKDFVKICDLIRDVKEEGIKKLHQYKGLENQKNAILAEIAYFDGDFEKAINYSMKVCPFWGEWHYANIKEEQLAAMAFAAIQIGKQDDLIKFFNEQIIREQSKDTHYYKLLIEFLETGEHFEAEEQQYKPD